MPKKIFIIILCVCMLLPSLVSCNRIQSQKNETPKADESNEQASDPGADNRKEPYDNPKDVFCDYYSIVNLYGTILKKLVINNRFNENCFDEIFAIYGDRLKNETESTWLTELTTAAWELHPGRHWEFDEDFDDRIVMENYINACGYAIKDLNGDGIDELVLLNYDYTVVALFTTVNRRPSLLETFSPSYTCQIDADGLIYTNYSETADKFVRSTYRISEDGAGLELIFKFGLDGHQWGDSSDGNEQELVEYYFKSESGKNTFITKEEYTELSEQYSQHFDGMSATASNKAFSGLQYKPVFKPPYTFGSYEEILKSIKKMTELHNVYKLVPNSVGAYDWYFDLSTEQNLKFYKKLNDLVQMYYPPAIGISYSPENAFAYGIKDFRGDGVDELILIDGDCFQAFAVLTKKDGRIVFDDSFSFELFSSSIPSSLSYWINAVGLDLKPLFPESSHFDLDAIRRETMADLDKMLSGNPYYPLWIVDEKILIDFDDYLSTLPYSPCGYAFVDMNGDTVKELIIKFTDRFAVISNRQYTYTINCDHIYTDGSFGWHTQDQGLTYGVSRFYDRIDPSESTEIWRIVNDGEPNAEYYIGGISVTEAEITRYTEANPRTEVEFTSIDELWGDRMSPLEALEIAREYWKDSLAELNANYPWDDDGYVCDFIYHSSLYQNGLPNVPENMYMFRLRSNYGKWETVAEIWIDAVTGEVSPPYPTK